MAEPNENWRLVLWFPDEYSDFVAEVYYRDKFVCLISQENGYEQLAIEIDSNADNAPWKFKLSEFEQALEKAKVRLWELRKIE